LLGHSPSRFVIYMARSIWDDLAFQLWFAPVLEARSSVNGLKIYIASRDGWVSLQKQPTMQAVFNTSSLH
jgi:hypothetical protein